jgi:hypothetical protein
MLWRAKKVKPKVVSVVSAVVVVTATASLVTNNARMSRAMRFAAKPLLKSKPLASTRTVSHAHAAHATVMAATAALVVSAPKVLRPALTTRLLTTLKVKPLKAWGKKHRFVLTSALK